MSTFANDFMVSGKSMTLYANSCLLMNARCEQSANNRCDRVCFMFGGSSSVHLLFKCSIISLSNLARFPDFAQYLVAYRSL